MANDRLRHNSVMPVSAVALVTFWQKPKDKRCFNWNGLKQIWKMKTYCRRRGSCQCCARSCAPSFRPPGEWLMLHDVDVEDHRIGGAHTVCCGHAGSAGETFVFVAVDTHYIASTSPKRRAWFFNECIKAWKHVTYNEINSSTNDDKTQVTWGKGRSFCVPPLTCQAGRDWPIFKAKTIKKRLAADVIVVGIESAVSVNGSLWIKLFETLAITSDHRSPQAAWERNELLPNSILTCRVIRK